MSEFSEEAEILKKILAPEKIEETHISYAFLTKDRVYKLKKKVDFGFLDYTQKKGRKKFCMLEKSLNERFAKGIYERVLKIVRYDKKFSLVPMENTLVPIDYVVEMKRIPDKNFLHNRISSDEISEEFLSNLGVSIASILKSIKPKVSFAEEYGSYEVIKKNWVENFEQTEPYIGKYINEKYYKYIKHEIFKFMETNKDLFKKRVNNGYVIDGHGDLRLEHVYFDNEKVGLIDCIEFNNRFRCNDVVADFVFLCMELDQKGYYDYSDGLLAGFLSVFDDISSRRLVNFYKCYRAFVRAKVTCFLLDQKDEKWPGFGDKYEELVRLVDLSLAYAYNMVDIKTVVFYGLMGAGKSKNAQEFCSRFASYYLNSDMVRKKELGIPMTKKVYIKFGKGIYSDDISLNIYNRLGEQASAKNDLCRMVVVDGSFSRIKFLEKFVDERVFAIRRIKCSAPDDVLIKRLEEREKGKETSVSDGRVEIFYQHKESFEDIGYNIMLDTADELKKHPDQIISYLIENET